MPDTDGDGRDDFLIGDPGEIVDFKRTGRAYLISGATSDVLLELSFPEGQRGSGFGGTLAGVPDADGDGRGDLLIGAFREGRLRAYLFSGATGDYRFEWDFPYDRLPPTIQALAGVPDTDGDGLGDVLIGNPGEDVGEGPWGGSPGAGRAYLYSGATGELLFALDSPAQNDFYIHFGSSVAGVPDINGDGRGDLLIGAPQENPGHAYLISGATGAILEVLASPNEESPSGGAFGSSVAGVPDTDGDGTTDLLIGARTDYSGGSPEASGRAFLFSGSDRTLLFEIAAPDEEEFYYFGSLVAGVPDSDGDNGGDLLVADYRFDFQQGGSRNSRVYLFSGSTGNFLFATLSPDEISSGHFGTAIAGVADADGDGGGDFLIGANGELKAYLFSGNPNAVASEDAPAAPDQLLSLSGHPNPFSGSAEIAFRLPAPGTARLAVYDVLGREVVVLADGRFNAGDHAVRFDGAGLPSGVYLVRVEDGTGTVATHRVTLVR